MAQKTRLLVRADDAGSCWACNLGCLTASTEGIARSVEVMMPCGWVTHAAELFARQPDIDIGIHLTLTSEWDAIKWRPLTASKSLVDETGHFPPLLTPRPGDGRRSLQDCDWRLEEIAAELDAQIQLGLRLFPQASHVSAHMAAGFSSFDQRVGQAVADLCQRYGLMEDPFAHGLPRFPGYPKHPCTVQARVTAFAEGLAHLEPGQTYIFIDHPAADSPDLTDMGHEGYEDVRDDRVSCLATLTDPVVLQAIEDRQIELISYRDLQAV